MKAVRALLVDDEPLAIRRLQRSLEKIGGVDVVGATTRAREAVALIDERAPDIVFIDIEMPGLNGLEVVGRLPADRLPAIVFVTAYDAYAARAFDLAAVDYLLKPVAGARLEEAVARSRKWLEQRRIEPESGAEPSLLTDGGSLWVHRNRALTRMEIGRIEWIEAEGDYARLHAGDGDGSARVTLNALAARLDPALFIRVHRRAICRKGAIVAMRRKPTGALSLTLAGGSEVPVGRTYAAGLRALLKPLGR